VKKSFAAIAFAAAMDAPSVISQPQKSELRGGEFLLRPDTKVFADKDSPREKARMRGNGAQ
jgi:hypothetical protein